MRTIDLGGGTWLQHEPEWLSEEVASALLATLLEEVAWEERPVVAFGKEILQPRLVGWAGELPYRYSGQTLPPREVTPSVRWLWDEVERTLGARFNHVVLNRYRNGRDHMAMHADNEPELGRDPLIAAVSLGATRRFTLEWKHKRSRKRSTNLRHGSLFVMGGTCQHRWRHAVPKAGAEVGERINVTFRWLHGPPGWRGDSDEAPRPDAP